MSDVRQDWPSGLKRTRQRELVLDVLREADQPMSAMDICAAIEKKGSPAWLSTVYRVLESFESKNVLVKVTVAGSDMALYELNLQQHKHYAVCVDCHKIIPMINCPVDRFVPELKEGGFEITGHNLEIFGHCKDCAASNARAETGARDWANEKNAR